MSGWLNMNDIPRSVEMLQGLFPIKLNEYVLKDIVNVDYNETEQTDGHWFNMDEYFD